MFHRSEKEIQEEEYAKTKFLEKLQILLSIEKRRAEVDKEKRRVAEELASTRSDFTTE